MARTRYGAGAALDGHEQREGELGVDLTPMIDIVFMLLIFFLVATKIRTTEGLIRCFLPKDQGLASAHQTKPVDLEQTRVKLLWRDEQVVLELGTEEFNAPGEVPAWQELYQRLTALKQAYRGVNPEGLPVIVDVHPRVPTQYAVSALNEVVRARITDVTFAAPAVPID